MWFQPGLFIWHMTVGFDQSLFTHRAVGSLNTPSSVYTKEWAFLLLML